MWVRVKVAALHFCISAIVLLLAFTHLRYIWYPDLLFSSLGAGDFLAVVLLVDLLLGPLCMFVVYKPCKPSLRFDMAIIVTVQLSALVYGLHTFWEGRPAYLVFNIDRITVVTAAELDDSALDLSMSPWYPLPRLGPVLVGALLPEDIEERNELTFEAISGGRDLPQLPRYYVPYECVREMVISRVRELSELDLQSGGHWADLQAILSKKGGAVEDLAYLPVQSRQGEYVAVVSRDHGNVLGYLSVSPSW